MIVRRRGEKKKEKGGGMKRRGWGLGRESERGCLGEKGGKID